MEVMASEVNISTRWLLCAVITWLNFPMYIEHSVHATYYYTTHRIPAEPHGNEINYMLGTANCMNPTQRNTQRKIILQYCIQNKINLCNYLFLSWASQCERWCNLQRLFGDSLCSHSKHASDDQTWICKIKIHLILFRLLTSMLKKNNPASFKSLLNILLHFNFSNKRYYLFSFLCFVSHTLNNPGSQLITLISQIGKFI